MKKQITFLLIMFIHATSWGQPTSAKTVACTDSMVLNSKGRWIKYPDHLTSFTKSQQLEAINRLNTIHAMLLKLYPKPMGVDIRWKNAVGICYFGSQRKFRYNRDSVLIPEIVNILPNAYYYYETTFPPYYCEYNDKGVVLRPGENNESNKGITVIANDLAGIVGGPAENTWTIEGQPVRMRSPMKLERWKGYVVHYLEPGSSVRSILIHREGILPYKPVTRKQYLDRCIIFQTNLYDKLIKDFEQSPVRTLAEQETEKKNKLAKFEQDFGKDPKRLKSTVDYYLQGYQTDQQMRDERITKARTNKEAELKKFTDELIKTTNEGLLDSPAVVIDIYYSNRIFETDPLNGYMLVTENPDYIRKDLPNYVPQFFVVWWIWSDYPMHRAYEKIFEEEFPLEKLREMIDK